MNIIYKNNNKVALYKTNNVKRYRPTRGVVIFSGGIGGSLAAAYSKDGVNFTEMNIINTTYNPSDREFWNAGCYSPQLNRLLLVNNMNTGVTTKKFAYSSNGINWTAATGSTTAPATSCAWSPTLNRFVAVCGTPLGGTGTAMYSSNGISWTNASYDGGPGNIAIGSYWGSVIWTGNKFVAVGQGDGLGRAYAMYSNDGITWVRYALSTSPADSRFFTGVAWSQSLGRFAAVATDLTTSSSSIYYSSDSITWVAGSASLTNLSLRDVCYSDEVELFVAVGLNPNVSGTFASNKILVSSDGMNWTSVTASFAAPWQDVKYSSELKKFFVVAQSNVDGGRTFLYSTDGYTWSPQTSSYSTNKSYAGIITAPYFGTT
jgi:hypothetical protein